LSDILKRLVFSSFRIGRALLFNSTRSLHFLWSRFSFVFPNATNARYHLHALDLKKEANERTRMFLNPERTTVIDGNDVISKRPKQQWQQQRP